MTEKPTYAELEQRVEELRKSEKQKRTILNASVDMIMQFDTDLRIVWANKTAASVVDKSAHDLVGHYCYKIFQDRDTPCPGCPCIKALETGNIENEIMHHPAMDIVGESYWDNRAVPIKDDNGQVVGLAEIARNITHRVLAEQSLRESEKRLKSTLDSIQAGIVVIDAETHIIVDANPAAIRMIGAPKEQVIGHICHKYICPAEEGKCPITDLGQKVDNSERILLTANGEEVPILKTATTMFLGGKECLLDTFIDITEKKKLEAWLAQSRKMDAISAMAGGIAHQFNNALFAIIGNIDLLKMNFPGNENIADYTRKMKDSTRRMTRLTAQLLAYARGGKYQAETISLSDFVRDTLPLVRHTIDSAISVDTEPPGIFNVKVDLTQMQMALVAVLTNAVEAMDGKGQIRIVCRNTMITDETAVDFPGLKPGNYVSLTITDDGKGMDEETKTRIFEPFFTTKFEGRGLGMAAVYGIVKNHDGWIAVDSELGKGTIVKIYLPAVVKNLGRVEH